MDIVTQVTLGAAVGEACLGRRAGNWAPFWGAVAGLVPDLDVLVAPLYHAHELLHVHRGITHSIFFSIVAALPAGWLVNRLHRKREIGWVPWAWLFFAAFLTHALLDAFTMFGTQLFLPFSNYRAGLDSIFIIDPLYTVPLGLGVLLAVFLRRDAATRRWVNNTGLALSTGYLLLTLVIKAHVEHRFAESLTRQGITYQDMFTAPTPLNAVLWSGMVRDGETIHVGLYSILDQQEDITFRRIERHSERLEPVRGQPPVDTLEWFSKGWYTVREKDGRLWLADVRFGRTDVWLRENGTYIFDFELVPDPDDPTHIVDAKRRSGVRSSDLALKQTLGMLWARIKGL